MIYLFPDINSIDLFPSGCNVCKFCHSGNPHYCKDGGINNTIGIYRNGGWAEYVLAPDYQVHRLPDKITFEQGRKTILLIILIIM